MKLAVKPKKDAYNPPEVIGKAGGTQKAIPSTEVKAYSFQVSFLEQFVYAFPAAYQNDINNSFYRPALGVLARRSKAST
jgi:hypothetical protein